MNKNIEEYQINAFMNNTLFNYSYMNWLFINDSFDYSKPYNDLMLYIRECTLYFYNNKDHKSIENFVKNYKSLSNSYMTFLCHIIGDKIDNKKQLEKIYPINHVLDYYNCLKFNKIEEFENNKVKDVLESLHNINLSSLNNFIEVKEKSQIIIQKYNLHGLYLDENFKLSDFIIIDNLLENVCQKLKIDNSLFGLDKKITIKLNREKQYHFILDNNVINIDFINYTANSLMTIEQVLIHEWIHALDYTIGNIFENKKFLSNIENLVYFNNEFECDLFYNLKKILQSLSNKNDVSNYLNEMKMQGIKIFLSYILDKEDLLKNIDKLSNNTALFIAINNFIIKPDDKHKDTIINILNENNIKPINNIKSENIKDYILYFEILNKNIIHKRSFYYFISQIIDNERYFYNLLSQLFFKQDSTNKKPFKLYFSDPCELLARYYEKNTSDINNQLYYLLDKMLYPYKKDINFNNYHEKVIKMINKL